MHKVTVTFEHHNFKKTIDYIRQYFLQDIDESHRENLEEYLQMEVKKLIDGDLSLWCKKDYGYFEHLCHHPLQGIACVYMVGDKPKLPIREFDIELQSDRFDGNVIACLYTYLT
jgi:hypothetical protein